jgi:hypothetical protein
VSPYTTPRCVGCDEYLSTDEIQGSETHECRLSSADLPEMVIALAQARCVGDRWEVDAAGYGFVVFDDPLAARSLRRVIEQPTTEGSE